MSGRKKPSLASFPSVWFVPDGPRGRGYSAMVVPRRDLNCRNALVARLDKAIVATSLWPVTHRARRAVATEEEAMM